MRCARRRWAIENETFKTLKSGDVHSFERNCGHGNNHLRDVFGLLAMPAFPVDQDPAALPRAVRKGAEASGAKSAFAG